MNLILSVYRLLFARPLFYRLNKLLYHCSLNGLGILNYQSDAISGEQSFLKKTLTPGRREIIFDVGANEGNYSQKVLEINPGAIIHAFEPHPATFLRLQARITSANFHPLNAAVGDQTGTLTLYDYADQDGSSHASLYKDVIEGIHKGRAREHKATIITLRDYITEQGISHIDLLKIDTEGNELSVLKGLGDIITGNTIAVIHFEFNEMNVASRTFFRDIWNLLPNYDFHRLLPNGMVKINEYSPVFCEIFAYQNIIATLKPAAKRAQVPRHMQP